MNGLFRAAIWWFISWHISVVSGYLKQQSTNILYHDSYCNLKGYVTDKWISLMMCIMQHYQDYCYFFVIRPTRCTNFTNLFWHETLRFGQFLRPSSGVYSLYTQQWYMSYRFVDSFKAGSGWIGQFLCPSSGVYSLYTQKWYMSYRFVDRYHCWVYSE